MNLYPHIFFDGVWDPHTLKSDPINYPFILTPFFLFFFIFIMAKGRNRIYFAIAFVISSIPAIFGIYAFKSNLVLTSSILFSLSLISMGISTFLFLGYKTVKHGTPMIFSILTSTSQSLSPITRYLSKTAIIGPLFSLVIRSIFFLGFIVLLMSDQLVRTLFKFMVGRHPSKRLYCKFNGIL